MFRENITRPTGKGRRFIPSHENDGNWYRTRGYPTNFDAEKFTNSTNTRQCPLRVPDKFEEKAEISYRRFRFSQHDHRNSLQNVGEYFGNGLGKRNLFERRQHYSNNLISWGDPITNNSCYSSSYRGSQTADPIKHRRFPRHHHEGDPSQAELSTTTTKWFKPNETQSTSLSVLAASQEPQLPANKWKYSYQPVIRFVT